MRDLDYWELFSFYVMSYIMVGCVHDRKSRLSSMKGLFYGISSGPCICKDFQRASLRLQSCVCVSKKEVSLFHLPAVCFM